VAQDHAGRDAEAGGDADYGRSRRRRQRIVEHDYQREDGMMSELIRSLTVFSGLIGFITCFVVFIWSTKFLDLENYEKHFRVGKLCVLGVFIFIAIIIRGLAG